MSPITDYNVYQNGMLKSLEDKLFFLDLVEDVDNIVDFGCADGQLLKRIHEEYSEWNLFGVDMDNNMLNKAKENCPEATYICSKDIPILSFLSKDNKSILNLSSVIHEVYSYCNKETVDDFWNSVFNSNYKYIAIRDMALGNSAYRGSDYNDFVLFESKADQEMLHEFKHYHGDIIYNNNLIHFLLKYRYIQNWSREVRENYFPITIEQILNKIDYDKYKIIYCEHYILPFLKDKVKEDFGITLVDNTHIKLLLERK